MRRVEIWSYKDYHPHVPQIALQPSWDEGFTPATSPITAGRTETGFDGTIASINDKAW